MGLKIDLPCMMGDWVYVIKYGQVNYYKVVRIEVDGNEKGDVYFKSGFEESKFPFCTLEDFGKTAFLTEEEAKTALSELQR